MRSTLVCEIEHYAIHDGPGIRTVVFLKGCPLRCLWCSNPETQRKENELYYNKSSCINCGACIKACKENALNISSEGMVINRNKCTGCDLCVNVCPTSSLKLVAKTMTVDDVFNEVMKDSLFYNQSGGGVTVSGGEALMNVDFVLDLFKLLKEHYVHTTLETTGFGDTDKLKNLSLYTDLFLFDLKHVDKYTHKTLTGVDNSLILKNLQLLKDLNKEVIIRIPLITNLNDSIENIQNSINIAKENNIKEIHLLPYHTLGLDKYRRLQKNYNLDHIDKPIPEYLNKLKTLIEESKIKCIIGG